MGIEENSDLNGVPGKGENKIAGSGQTSSLEVAATLLWVGGWETLIWYADHTKSGAINSGSIVVIETR
jgi:hypothetical protein